jgi:hypothetical protein
MMSKRTCGFLTTSVAKRLKLVKDSERLVNSFLMKPRDYYNYVHGTPPRHKAYTLCLAAIHSSGADVLMGLNWELVQLIAKDLFKWKRYGVRLSNSFQTISRKELVRNELIDLFYMFECKRNHYWE